MNQLYNILKQCSLLKILQLKNISIDSQEYLTIMRDMKSFIIITRSAIVENNQ